MFIVAALLLAFAFSDGRLPLAKMCCSRGKTRDKYVFAVRSSLLSLYKVVKAFRYIHHVYKSGNKKTNKSNVERGNFVCQIEGHKQYRSCPLPGHSSAMNPTPIPARLFQVFDEVGKSMLLYRPGTRWCTSCRRNADKKFPSMAKY